MTETGGTTTTSPRSSRLVVVVGGGVPDTRPPTGPVALDSRALSAHIAQLTAAAASASADRRHAIEARRNRLGADLEATRAELSAAAERERARRSDLAQRTAAVDAVTERRRANLEALRGAVSALDDAVRQWSKVLDQQRDANSALDALRQRIGGDDAPAAPERIVEEMAEGEQVLERTEASRRGAVDVAMERLVAVRSVLEGDTDPLRLAGLMRLRDTLEHGDGDTSAFEQRCADLDEQVAEAAGELAGEQPEPIDLVGVTLDLVTSAAKPHATLVVDDVLADLDDTTCQAVLDALPERLDSQLVYLTGDLRVLSWAIGLSPTVGGVAGAADPTNEN